MFRTIPIGKADPKHYKMHEACVEALKNCENKLIPGNKIGEVFEWLFFRNYLFSKLDGLANVIHRKST